MGFRPVPFAGFAVGIGAGGVEIAQSDVTQSVAPGEVAKNPLDRLLGDPIGIDRVLRMLFRDRQKLRQPVNRTAA